MKTLLLYFCLCLSSIGFGQIERGSLILDTHPSVVDAFITDGKVNLTVLRQHTNLLTNRYLNNYQGLDLPKKKKAFIRHIKHLSEALEFAYQNNHFVDDSTYEMIYELNLFYLAYLEKSKLESKGGPNFFEKLKLFWTHVNARSHFKYTDNNIAENLTHLPKSSPYWHRYNSKKRLHKRFKYLAKAKKVKARKNMVVLFEKLSYSGSAPKIRTRDLDLDNEWVLKWGDEVHTDVVGSRVFAALGYDVDHPYFYAKEALTLVFLKSNTVQNSIMLCDSLEDIYNIDLMPFIYKKGQIDSIMVKANPKLLHFIGENYVQFIKCAIEARPDRVKRIGPFLSNMMGNEKRLPLRGALLAHAFIGNWDTSERNTVLTTVHNGNYEYRISAAYSDLGTSFGVKISPVSGDFKVGLVNAFPWKLVELKPNGELQLNYQLNTLTLPFKNATYQDLKWMAEQIHDLDSTTLRKIVDKAGWPYPIAELYFHKLASRRASILNGFKIKDEHPILFNEALTIVEEGKTIVKNGVLLCDYKREAHPESFLSPKGRFRNYGN